MGGGSRTQETTSKTESTQISTRTDVGDIGFTGAQGVEAIREVVTLAGVGVKESANLSRSLVEASAQSQKGPPVVVVGGGGDRSGKAPEKDAGLGGNLPLIVASAAAVAALVSLNR